MRVNLGSYPAHSKEYVEHFEMLNGGLNLSQLAYRLKNNESPNMRNLWWQEGVLQCRDGQAWVNSDTTRGVGYTCYSELFHGRAFFHIGSRIWYADPTDGDFVMTPLAEGVPGNRGTFFRYGERLYYKNRGGFFRIAWDGSTFTAEPVGGDPYVPTTIINADPSYGSGDTYQPVNRLTGKRTVTYNAAEGVKVYKLLADSVASVDRVVVDGVETTAYAADLSGKTVTFTTAPPVTDPPTNNTVAITFTVADTDAYNAVMDCIYAHVAGGDGNLCVVLAGCPAQPNAIFWNSNDAVAMNDSYWPSPYYNLVGDTEDPVTGFGKQYSDNIVFKSHAVGKLAFGVEELEGRSAISFTYTLINDRVGCDLPGSIQLIENNLVFCNTYRGVHILRSSSAAYENNIDCISEKVNGSAYMGLLRDTRAPGVVTSFDDDSRYWLCAEGRVYLWDYAVSSAGDPSWYYFTEVSPVAMLRDDSHKVYHLDALGRVTAFERSFSDYGLGIEKLYQFPVMSFGTYARLKDVDSVIFAVRADTDTDMTVTYNTDYETREDPTPILAWHWRLVPRNLAYRMLGGSKFAQVAKRRPGCRHVRHFSMMLTNSTPGKDMAVVSARVFYRYQGKERQ